MPTGYKDTPLLPGTRWHVHDSDRPRRPIVVPPTASSQTQQGLPPSDAVVLFDGSSLDQWRSRSGGEAAWTLMSDDRMEVAPGAGDIETRDHFGSCQLHVEWRAPTEIRGESQGRGNSGVFLLGLYEIQVLDGFENPTYADGEAASIYGQYPPLVNACVAPGIWHSFDVVFETPEFEDGNLSRPAYLTVFHNGLLVHLRQKLQGPTLHRGLAEYTKEHGPKGPLKLQDHGDKLQFRNIWIREISSFVAD